MTQILEQVEEGSAVNASTARLQTDLWSTLLAPAAAWWNRIPIAAWAFMAVIAICCNVFVGHSARCADGKTRMFFVSPLILSISFFLIADIDSPRGGLIHVQPEKLESLSRVAVSVILTQP